MPRKVKGASQTTPDDSQAAPPPPKRARNAQSRVKGKKGALKGVLELPMDLIWEICTHLDVGDLLALSNTNKSFRSVVTGESSSMLFKRARQRIGLPELLSPMPDLRYAELMFGKGCNICGKSNAGKVDPLYRARICSACLKDKFVEWTKLETKGLNQYYPDDLRRMSTFLNAKFPASATSGLFLDEQMEEELEIFGYGADLDEAELEERRKIRAFQRSDWEFVSLVRKNNAPSPEGDFQKWYLEFHNERKLREQDSQALQEWLKKMEIKKSDENEKTRSGRREEIERRFEAMGFEKSEFRAQSFRNHPQVKSTRPLSDRTFSTTVEPPVRKVLEDNRRSRLRSILRNRYENFVRDHAERDYLPPSNVYLQLSILEPTLSDTSQNPSNSFLLRSIVAADTDLADELDKKKKKKQSKGKEKGFSPSTNYCPIDKLPLQLPRLPPWLPRSNDEPILASDEQLLTFLESSSLAFRIECSKCQKAFSVRELFKHFSSPRSHPIFSESGERIEEKATDWLRIGESDDEEKPFARFDKNVLSLSLKLQQLVESTPLIVDESKQLPSLGDEDSDWYVVLLRCACQSVFEDGLSLSRMVSPSRFKLSQTIWSEAFTPVRPSHQRFVEFQEVQNHDIRRLLESTPRTLARASRSQVFGNERVRRGAWWL
ncbi:F-box protein [Sporobolomyces salmoneus]|uniref:F-box protein n=1 Tax=Sporobolomyces salmoneus TaxID=183962 RepID=UPI00316EEE0C